jgi:hypothetical protein
VIWAEKIGGGGEDIGRGISQMANGQPVVTGTFYGDVDFDPYEVSNNHLILNDEKIEKQIKSINEGDQVKIQRLNNFQKLPLILKMMYNFEGLKFDFKRQITEEKVCN